MSSLRFPLVLLALAAAGCGDDDETGPPPTDYYLNITWSPPAVTFAAGGNVDVQLVITRGGLYPGAITLEVEGLPASIFATFNPPILTGTNDRSTLTLTASPQAAPGPCPFTVRASGAEVEDEVTPAIGCLVTP